MYIQITTRCNMECAHCCYACTTDGEDMSFRVFKEAIAMDNEAVAIGGGEPTVHPQFEKFLLYAIAHVDSVWIATNGKKKALALLLAKLARSGIISAALSQDDYHEPISAEVVQAFQRATRSFTMPNDNDCREIRNVTGKEAKAGRCTWGDDTCCCEDRVITPNGDMYWCGCPDAPKLGNIMTGLVIPKDYNSDCHRAERRIEDAENG